MFTRNSKGLYQNEQGVVLPLGVTNKIILIFNDVDEGYYYFLKSGCDSLDKYLSDLLGEW